MTTASLELLKGKAASAGKAKKATPAPPEPETEPDTHETPQVVIEEDAGDEIDVDSMTVSELDALVQEYEIDVPAHWWKKAGEDKKLTSPQKKAWLTEKFAITEEGETEAETPVETPMTAEDEAPDESEETPATTNLAKVTTPEVAAASKEIATAPQPTSGELLDADELSDLVHEIENLKQSDARELAVTLAEQVEFTYFKLGGVLALIQGHKWFDPYPTFKEYVEQEHGLHYRKAMYLVGIYRDMTKASIPWGKVKHLGWTKMAILSPILTSENLASWVTIAEANNVDSLTEMVKTAKINENGAIALPDGTQSANVTTKTFKLHEDQKSTVEAALAKAREASGTKVDTVALEFIALDFLGSTQKTPSSLPDQLKKVGIDTSLEALSKAFPTTNFAVEV